VEHNMADSQGGGVAADAHSVVGFRATSVEEAAVVWIHACRVSSVLKLVTVSTVISCKQQTALEFDSSRRI
jgi:hypothetical protein